MQTQLLVPQIEFPVRVGCNQEERSRPQAVEFSIRLVFAEPPPGCWTDELEHTICYGKITEILGEVCQSQSFKLIEHLAWKSFAELRQIAPSRSRLSLEVRKVRPPIPQIKGPSCFEIEDLIP
ncbi:MAG: dihydroneopterin aldolase [Bdellovibrionaceae bacterium]|nr:dihydroneopterin aldolase [Bdellovibrionales bacterium]MCB9085071.1 dihydroneopterin aldolase [Pseudobdellovibrionaceae bacterium]